ncbi:hypothetical protein BHMPCIPO_01924 [Ensifer sesbaniae]|nr:hypothetical protein [Ensifer sesbaniae]
MIGAAFCHRCRPAHDQRLRLRYRLRRTLGEWRERFWSVWNRIEPLGFDLRFKWLWEFYFYYCEAGFRARNITLRQIVFE